MEENTFEKEVIVFMGHAGMMQHEWYFQRTTEAQVKKYSYCIRSR